MTVFLRTLAISLVLAGLLPSFAAAVVFHTIGRLVPTEVFLFTGSMHVPKYPPHGTSRPYLWPGLQGDEINGQHTTNGALLQSVLDGHPRGEVKDEQPVPAHWYFGGNLYKTNVDKLPPHGGGFDVERGTTVQWTHQQINRNRGWMITEVDQNGREASHRYTIEQKLVLVTFAVELQEGMVWDFGPVVFTDITIGVFGTDTRWCTSPWDFNGVATRGAMMGVQASVEKGKSFCKIKRLVLSPA